MQRLHELLAAGRHPNCRRVAFEFEVSSKTIFRDLEFMRDQLKLPVQYDQKMCGYIYTRAVECPIALSIPPRRSDGSQNLLSRRPNEFTRTREYPSQRIPARIWFASQVASEVVALYPTNRRALKVQEDGSVELVIKDSLLYGLDRWILSWGALARVIEPLWLREKVMQMARDLVDLYRTV